MNNKGKEFTISLKPILIAGLLVFWPFVYFLATNDVATLLRKILFFVAMASVIGGLFLWRRVTRCPACGSTSAGRVMTPTTKPAECPACKATILKRL